MTRGAADSPVSLPAALLSRYDRFSCYNSPYPAHDRGCAVDLYPDSNAGLSPVPGEILATRTVGCPDHPYAVDEDHLIVIDVADDWAGGRGADLVARVLHVDPTVSPGDEIAVGDSLGEMVRSGFFGQWVDNHVHLGFRNEAANPYRASGSLPVVPAVPVAGAPWDGTGTVVERGETFVRLDSPAHPSPGNWATIAADDGTPLDGGLVHYSGGGAYTETDGPLSLLGTEVGTATPRARPVAGGDNATGTADVAWSDVRVRANSQRATGLSLFASRDSFGAKLVFHEGHEFTVGEELTVEIDSGTPVRLE
jgi:hypothetical protein